MRSFLAMLAAVTVLAACGSGGDSPTEPEPPYPALSGAFAIDATFDDFPPSIANATGTVSFTQPSRESGALQGTANLTIVLGTEEFSISGISNATVSTSGAVRFQVGQSGGTAAWGFDGTLSSNGAMITGTHILADDTESFTGSWTGTRQ